MTDDTSLSTPEPAISWIPEKFLPWIQRNVAWRQATEHNSLRRDFCFSGAYNAPRLLTALMSLVQLQRQAPKGKVSFVFVSTFETYELVVSYLKQVAASTPLKFALFTPMIVEGANLLDLKHTYDDADIVVINPRLMPRISRRFDLKTQRAHQILVTDVEHLVDNPKVDLSTLFNLFPTAAQRLLVLHPSSLDKDWIGVLLRAPWQTATVPEDPTHPSQVKQYAIVLDGLDYDRFLITHTVKPKSIYVGRLLYDLRRVLRNAERQTLQVEIQRERRSWEDDPEFHSLVENFVTRKTDVLLLRPEHAFELEHHLAEAVYHLHTPIGTDTLSKYRCLLEDRPTSELVLIINAKEVDELHRALTHEGIRLELQNPTNIPDMPEFLGAAMQRERLSVRADYKKDTSSVSEAEPLSTEEAVLTTPEPLPEDVPPVKPLKRSRQPRSGLRQRNPRKARKVESAPVDLTTEANDTERSEEPKGIVALVISHAKATEGSETPESLADEPVTSSSDTPRRKPLRERNAHKRTDRNARQRNANKATDAECTDKSPRGGKPHKKADRNGPKKSAQPANTSSRKSANNFGGKGKRSESKMDKARSPQRAASKANRSSWDDDNFGNSIYYQPKRQDLRTLRSDQPMHWEPVDPYHPSSQALSLPQTMPDDGFRPRGQRGNGAQKRRSNPNKKRPRKNGPWQ